MEKLMQIPPSDLVNIRRVMHVKNPAQVDGARKLAWCLMYVLYDRECGEKEAATILLAVDSLFPAYDGNNIRWREWGWQYQKPEDNINYDPTPEADSSISLCVLKVGP